MAGYAGRGGGGSILALRRQTAFDTWGGTEAHSPKSQAPLPWALAAFGDPPTGPRRGGQGAAYPNNKIQ